eukprot:429309-Prorocentrum_minimum.AAC.1
MRRFASRGCAWTSVSAASRPISVGIVPVSRPPRLGRDGAQPDRHYPNRDGAARGAYFVGLTAGHTDKHDGYTVVTRPLGGAI